MTDRTADAGEWIGAALDGRFVSLRDSALEFVILGDDPEQARALAGRVGATLYTDDRVDVAVPFRTLIRFVTDDAGVVADTTAAGRYVVAARVMKARTGPIAERGVIGLYPMVGRAELGHVGSDAHWRDIHAPLALRHHVGMSHYTQLSVVHTIGGFPYDGFALCGFDSPEDLRDRFFDGPEGRKVITADVASFADTTRSPRRLIATETQF